MSFRVTVVQTGRATLGIPLPEDEVLALGAGKRPPVLVTLGDYTYRTTVAPMKGQYWVGLSAERRAESGLAAGEEVEVSLVLDTAPRVVEVPADLAQALAADDAAREFFENLSYSNRLRHVLAIEGAKAAETRARRIDKAVALFREGRS